MYVYDCLLVADVKQLAFSVDGRFLFCCGDRQVKVFHNVTGYKAKVSDFTKQLETCNKNMERRITEQLDEARYAIDR